MSAHQKIFVRLLFVFFVGLIAAASNLTKTWVYSNFEFFKMYSVFGQVIEFKEVLPTFWLFSDFFQAVH